jgi:uncharacterized protein (DUF342 family)
MVRYTSKKMRQMALKATGDVTIKSAVGKSTIEAEENVLIAQGFIGGAIIKARDEINITEYASHCDLLATNKIQLGA